MPIKKIIKYLLFLPLLTPLFVGLNTTPFPFVILKAVYFSVVLGIIILLGAYSLFEQKKIVFSKNKLILAISLYFLIVFLSVIFSVNFHTSFWGTLERMEGFVFLLPFLFYFLFLILFLKQEKDWSWCLKALLSMGWVVIFLGVIQYFASVEKPFLTIGGSSRVYSTLGNYIYLGHFSLYIFWFSIILFFQEKKWRWVWLGSALVGFLGIYLAQSRGPFLGWVLSLFLFGLIYLFIAQNKKARIISGFSLGVIALFLFLAIFLQPKVFQNVLVVSGLGQIKTLGGSADTRLMAWDIAWQAFKEKPVTGWGNFSYQIAFNKYYNPEFLAHGWGETWFDHSHNQFFDTLANEGLLGFLSFISLFFLSTWLLIKKMLRDKMSGFVSLSAISLLGSLFINYLFAFDNYSTTLLLFVFLAWIVFWTGGENWEKKNNWLLKLAVFFMVCVGVVILYAGLVVFSAAKNDRKALVNFQKDPVGTISLMKSYIEKAGPFAYELRNDFAQTINSAQRPEIGEPEVDLFVQITKEGILMLEENIKINPYDIRRQMILEQMYKDLTLLGIDKTKEATDLLESLKILSPRRQQIYYYLAEIKLLQNDYDGAVAEVQKTLDGTFGVYQGYWFLAKLEGSRGGWLKAKEYLDLAFKNGFHPLEGEIALVEMINNEAVKN